MKVRVKYLSVEITPCVHTLSSPSSFPGYFLEEDFDPFQESLYVLALDSRMRVGAKKEVSKGSGNRVVLSPSEIFRWVLLSGCNSFIIAHNHPSGDTTPSEDDIHFTRRLETGAKLLGLKFVDHVILSHGERPFSFRKEAILGQEGKAV